MLKSVPYFSSMSSGCSRGIQTFCTGYTVEFIDRRLWLTKNNLTGLAQYYLCIRVCHSSSRSRWRF